MTALQALLTGLSCVALFMTVTWLIQLRTRDAGVVDAVWSWSLGFLGLLYALIGPAPLPQRIALGLMAGLWGLRLGTHIFLRNHGKPEDRRYRQLREEWGAQVNLKMFGFYQFQAIVALALSSSFLVAAYNLQALPVWPIALAVSIWLVSVAGEGIADWQMERFRADPANHGQVCRQGLWRYSRHPNYFFECLHWLAYLPLVLGSSWWWAALFSPVLMAYLLMKLSGIPLLERDMAQRKPGYAEYMRTTSPLIPWPPKRA